MLTITGCRQYLYFVFMSGLFFLMHTQVGMASVEPKASEQVSNVESAPVKNRPYLAALTAESKSSQENKTAKNIQSGSAPAHAADLTITELDTTFSTYTRKGRRMLAMESQVKNQGDVAADGFNVGFYLSTDDVYDATDILAADCTLTVASLAANALYPPTGTSSTRCAFPKAATRGEKYYIIGVVDYAKTVAESDENNNSKRTALSVAIP